MKILFRLVAWALALVWLFSAYGGLIDPRHWSLPSLATLAFPVVSLVAAGVLLLLLYLRQWRSALIIAVAAVLCWPSLRLILPLHFGKQQVPDGAVTLRVMSMNVQEFNWLHGNTSPSKSMRYILDQDADIVVMQEGTVYFSYERLKPLATMLDELYSKYPYRSEGLFDVGILSKYPFTVVNDTVFAHDQLDYFIKAWDVAAPGGDLRVYSMHLMSMRLTANDRELWTKADASASDRIDSLTTKLSDGFDVHAMQATAMRRSIDNAPVDVLVMGDMNDTPASFAYRTICGSDMRDAWADAGRGIAHSFNRNHLFVKIDHILYRGNLQPISCQCVRAGDSDHYPIVATFTRQ